MKTNIISNKLPSRAGYVLGAVGLFVATLLPSLNLQVGAASIANRQMVMASSATGDISTNLEGNNVPAGQGGNGAQTSHTFNFAMPAGGAVQSIQFRYCLETAVISTCTAPEGMDLSTVTGIADQTGGAGFAFGSISRDADSGNDNPTPLGNVIRINRTNPAVEAGSNFSFTFGSSGAGWIKNPTTPNEAFFVQITTYTDNAYTTVRDTGTVASATTQQIDITARVQEKLKFSVGSTAPSAPDATCEPPFNDTGALTLGDSDGVLDSSTQYAENSWFRISTNALNGTVIYYSGDTLKSGANTIAGLATEDVTLPGNAGFGLAIDSGGAGHSFAGGGLGLVANANYDEGNGALGTAKFNYDVASVTTPVAVANSSSVIVCDTGSVRYIGNISTTTPAGIYTTTITYIAVPAF